jgi:hypothetical protein
MKLYFDDENFDGQLQRTVGKCDAGRPTSASAVTSRLGSRLPIATAGTPGGRRSPTVSWRRRQSEPGKP